MNGESWPAAHPADLLPASLRTELRMAGGWSWSDDCCLKFRLDPGRAFELQGFIRLADWDRYHGSLSQRYRADGQLIHVVQLTGMTPGSVPERLSDAVVHARRLAARWPGWCLATRRAPAWSVAWPWRIPDAALHANETAAGRAHDTRAPHFTYRDGERVVCDANPPVSGLFFSVTSCGDWSGHEGPETIPFERSPGAALYDISDPGPARLAASDHPKSAAVPASGSGMHRAQGQSAPVRAAGPRR
jgi:hypothetical protein